MEMERYTSTDLDRSRRVVFRLSLVSKSLAIHIFVP